jgi:YD repeat-containing protein
VNKSGNGAAWSFTNYLNQQGRAITNTGSLNRQLSYDAQTRLVQVTLGSPFTETVALAYNAFGQRANYSVTPTGAGQPSLSESFRYQGDQLAQVAYTGTSVTTPYTDTYVYTQETARRWSCCGKRRAAPRRTGTCWTARATWRR